MLRQLVKKQCILLLSQSAWRFKFGSWPCRCCERLQASLVIREMFFVILPGSILVETICLAPLMMAEVKQVLCTSCELETAIGLPCGKWCSRACDWQYSKFVRLWMFVVIVREQRHYVFTMAPVLICPSAIGVTRLFFVLLYMCHVAQNNCIIVQL